MRLVLLWQNKDSAFWLLWCVRVPVYPCTRVPVCARLPSPCSGGRPVAGGQACVDGLDVSGGGGRRRRGLGGDEDPSAPTRLCGWMLGCCARILLDAFL